MKTRLTFIHALSPLHAGTGQGVDIIDMPIAREKATGIPFLPGSSVKGTMRDLCEDEYKIKVFGPDTDNGHEHAGAIVITDQRLLLLPVRSLLGTFAWVTSPYLLHRFVRDSRGTPNNLWPTIPEPADIEQCFVSGTGNTITIDNDKGKMVYIEDIDLNAGLHIDATEWADQLAAKIFQHDTAWKKSFNERFCLVHDNLLGFLLNTATEVTARIRLEPNTKTVKSGALWYEESLPTETILTGLAVSTPIKKFELDDDEIFSVVSSIINKNNQPRPLQFGGKATVGRGLCNVRLV